MPEEEEDDQADDGDLEEKLLLQVVDRALQRIVAAITDRADARLRRYARDGSWERFGENVGEGLALAAEPFWQGAARAVESRSR